ncbi:MAG: phosphate signaling complex protein PhoU [Candidatus Latescibacterota bacterium]|jgi:phosphate transport system protein
MPRHLERDLDNLSKQLLTMGAMVEEATNKAFLALSQRRKDIAQEVVDGDNAINEMENQVEEECLKILALYQPVATDLRFIITALKVNNDLERIADLAVNIAERAKRLAEMDPNPLPESINKTVSNVQAMVRDSLNSLVNMDSQLARKVCELDDEVDNANRRMFNEMEALMKQDPSEVERAISTLSVSRHLERIADVATNIAEDVIFLVEGEIVRHNL